MIRRLIVCAALVSLAACGGGGGSVPASSPAKAQANTQAGNVVISIPTGAASSSSKARYPQFVSPNAASVTLSVNGGALQTFDVSATSSLCTTVSTARNCTLAFAAPVGSDTFAFIIYSAANGTGVGTNLASATTTETIAADSPFGFTLAMNAAVGTMVVTVVPTTGQHDCQNTPQNQTGIPEGCPGGGTLDVTVYDPSGAAVTGTAPFAVPITVAANDPAMVPSPSTLTAPGQTVSATYSGAPFGAAITNSVTFTLTAGTQSASVHLPVARAYLYVANTNAPQGTTPTGGGNIAVYAYGSSGSATPARTIAGSNTQLYNPIIPLLDASDDLYVLDNESSNPSILEFAPGANANAAPIGSIVDIGAVTTSQTCDGMTFDPSGRFIFLACADGKIHVFALPTTTAEAATTAQTATLVSASFDLPVGMAFDALGNLYVADISYNSIGYYAAPVPTSGTNTTITALKTMSGGTSWSTLVAPGGLAFDTQGTLYAAIASLTPSPGTADGYNELGIWKTTSIPCTNCLPGASLSFSPSIHFPGEVVLDYGDNLYFSNPASNTITAYAAATVSAASGPTVNATVLHTLNTGSSPDAPLGMTVGP